MGLRPGRDQPLAGAPAAPFGLQGGDVAARGDPPHGVVDLRRQRPPRSRRLGLPPRDAGDLGGEARRVAAPR